MSGKILIHLDQVSLGGGGFKHSESLLSDIYFSMYLYTPFRLCRKINISQIQLRGGWVSKRKLSECIKFSIRHSTFDVFLNTHKILDKQKKGK